MNKGMHPPLVLEGWTRISQELPRYNTFIAAKIYNALLRNRIEPQIENILRKNQNGFWRNGSTTSQILTTRRILEVYVQTLEATISFVDFANAFDSIHCGKM